MKRQRVYPANTVMLARLVVLIGLVAALAGLVVWL